MNLREVVLQPVAAAEEACFRSLMATHHDLGALPKIGDTLWYVATWQGQWLALPSFSAAPGSVPRATPGSAGIFATIKIVCT